MIIAAFICGCSAGNADPAFWEPVREVDDIVIGAGGQVTVGPDAAPPLPPPMGEPGTPCQLDFSVTTVTAGGRYTPHNVGAIWISDVAGGFVKTLRTWGGPVRLPNATAWLSVSDGNVVDAVTEATHLDHGPVAATWDCTDTTGTPVSTGTYRVMTTFAEDNASVIAPPPLHVATVGFETEPRPLDVAPADEPNFTQMVLTLR